MDTYKVVYVEPVPAEIEAIARQLLPPGFELQVRQDNQSVDSLISAADFVLVATTPLSASAIAAGKRIRLIQHQGVGYDSTDTIAAAAHGIPVATCPTGTSTGVAEHVFLLILALYKHLFYLDNSVRRGEWLQWGMRSSSYEIAGKTLGILGLGRIGREVASRARAFKANVIYYDNRRASNDLEAELSVRFVPFEELISRSDILSLHTALNPETHHLIGDVEFGRMKASAILINTARGPVVDERALVRALNTGQIAGAGLDVFETEPLPADHPLLKLPNVVLTPHISAGTFDAFVTKLEACYQNMIRVVKGEPPLDVVNGKAG